MDQFAKVDFGPPTQFTLRLGRVGGQHHVVGRTHQLRVDDDVLLVAGNTYEVGFEVHLWEYTTRDHYISLPMTVSLGNGGDIEAMYVDGTGSFPQPNWDDTDTFPETHLSLFQPGINTWEFLVGDNLEDGKVSFKIVLEFGDNKYEMDFAGKIEESKLTGELKTSRGTSKVTGTKVVRTYRRRSTN